MKLSTSTLSMLSLALAPVLLADEAAGANSSSISSSQRRKQQHQQRRLHATVDADGGGTVTEKKNDGAAAFLPANQKKGGIKKQKQFRHPDQSDLTRSKHPWCGTADPTDEQMSDADLVDLLYKEKKAGRRQLQDAPIVIPICHHMIYPATLDEGLDDSWGVQVPDEEILGWTEGMNLGFSSESCCSPDEPWCAGDGTQCSVDTGIQFVAPNVDFGDGTEGPCITHNYNDEWFYGGIDIDSELELEMKTQLRVGEADVLNVYHFLFGDETGLGRAVFPKDYNLAPIVDGVIMNAWYIPETDYYTGTLIHEVGHWLGLWHTFQGPLRGAGSGCSRGDEVDDTSAAAEPNFECPIGIDSCPEIDGVDPVHNWMDYTSVACQYEFTSGQKERMRAQWDLYRDPNTRNETVVYLADPETEDTIVLDLLVQGGDATFVVETPVGATLTCFTSAANGDVDLYMNIGDFEGFDSADCLSQNLGSVEDSCQLAVTTAEMSVVHVAVLATKTSTDITVRCTDEPTVIPPPVEWWQARSCSSVLQQ